MSTIAANAGLAFQGRHREIGVSFEGFCLSTCLFGKPAIAQREKNNFKGAILQHGMVGCTLGRVSICVLFFAKKNSLTLGSRIAHELV